MNSERSVAIVGGGITGLSAAWHLHQNKVRVTLYEAAPRVGGVICSWREGDWLAEGGPNTILETSPRIARFVDELGLSSRRRYSDPTAAARYVVRDRRPVKLPSGPAQFVVSRLFSASAKARMLREPFIGRGRGEESVADFVRRRLGQEFLDYAVDPLVTGIYAGDPARLSIQHAFPRIYGLEARHGSLIRGQLFGARERRRHAQVARSRAPKFSFDDGLQVLPDTLGGRLGRSVELRTRVEEIRRDATGWRLTLRRGRDVAEAKHAAVAFCGTSHALAQVALVANAPVDLAPFEDIPYPPVASIVLGFRREAVAHPCCGFGMLIPDREGFGILGSIFSSALFPRRAPPGHLMLTTYVGGARHPARALLPDEELVSLVQRDLASLLGASGPPVFRKVTVWPRAIPQYELGYGRFQRMLAELETNAPGFFVAGHFRDGVALSDSILAGERVALRMAGFLTGRADRAPAAAEAPVR